jgi:hypothetical protein
MYAKAIAIAIAVAFGPNGGLDSRRKHSIAALVGMFLAATIGAILNWSWWLECLLIVPWAGWLIASEHLVVYRQLRPGSSDRRVPVVLIVPVLFAAAIQTARFSGLVVAVAFVVVCIFSRDHRTSASR